MRDRGEQAARRLSLNLAPKPGLERKLWANGPAPFRARRSPRPPAPTHQRTSCQRFSPGVPRPAMPHRPAALSLPPRAARRRRLGCCRPKPRARSQSRARRGRRRAGLGGRGAQRCARSWAERPGRTLLPTAPVGRAPRPWSRPGWVPTLLRSSREDHTLSSHCLPPSPAHGAAPRSRCLWSTG